MTRTRPAKSQMSNFTRSARAFTVLGLVLAATSTAKGIENKSFLQKTPDQDELLMVVEVSRHGAREPSKILNYTQDPNQNFNGTGNIMPLGKKQHFDLGQHLRQRYINDLKFLSANYTDNEVYVQTTYKQRTYLSSLYQLMGLYPDNQPPLSDYINYDIGREDYLSPIQKSGSIKPKVTTFNVVQIDAQADLLLHVDKDNCPRYAMTAQMTAQSDEYAKVQKYFIDNFLDEFERATNTSLSFKQMVEVCGYMQWAELANLTLNFTPTASIDQYCLAMGDTKLYSVSYGLDELWKLGAFEFLNKLNYISNALKDGVQLKIKGRLPKLIHYAAHAETLAAFFDGLGIHRVKRSFPGSALFFEIYKNSQDAIYVKLNYFHGDNRTVDVVKFPNQQEDTLSLSDFMNNLQKRLSQTNFTDVKNQCQNTNINTHPSDFYSGDRVLQELEEAYQTQKMVQSENSYIPDDISTQPQKLFLNNE
eukprot:403335592